MLAAKRLPVGDDKAAPIEVDGPGLRVGRAPSKAKAGRDLPTIHALKLQLLPDDYTPGACFFFAAALSLHALSSRTPLHGADLQVQATIVYREQCGIEVEENALSVFRALEQKAWGTRIWGRLPNHFRSLACHMDGKVVLLCTNTHTLMCARFGSNIAVTCAALWSPGMAEAKVHHMTHEMEEACEQACVIIIGEAGRDEFRSGGHFRGASYDRSLQVAPLCVLHGIMGTLVYTREALKHFSQRRVQLGVGGIKGHTGKRDLCRTRLVQVT